VYWKHANEHSHFLSFSWNMYSYIPCLYVGAGEHGSGEVKLLEHQIESV
jgi:hypothetical protein